MLSIKFKIQSYLYNDVHYNWHQCGYLLSYKFSKNWFRKLKFPVVTKFGYVRTLGTRAQPGGELTRGSTTAVRGNGSNHRPSLQEGPSAVAVGNTLNYYTGHKSKLDSLYYRFVVSQPLFCNPLECGSVQIFATTFVCLM